tara:strand:+ start:287 stop:634 length:348 start_codon:yes stop_codon:yes gene_type:complete
LEKLKVFEKMVSVMAEPKSDSKIGLYVGLAIQAAGIVWWASNLNSEVQHNDFQIQMMSREVSKNSNFVELWPAGKWGSGELPSDTRQDLHISELQKRVEKLMDELYTLKAAKGDD